MNPAIEQGLLYAVAVVILLGTLTVFILQYVRTYGRKRRRPDDDTPDDGNPWR